MEFFLFEVKLLGSVHAWDSCMSEPDDTQHSVLSFSDQSNFLDGCQVFDSNPDWISQSFKVEKQRSRLMLSS